MFDSIKAGPPRQDANLPAFNNQYSHTRCRDGFFRSDLARAGIDIYAPVHLFAVQSLPLFEDDQGDTCRQNGSQRDQSGYEAREAVGEDKAGDGSARRSCGPVDISSLYAHQFERPLQSFEQRVVGIAFVLTFHRTGVLYVDTEEHGQGFGRRDQKEAGTDYKHDFFLQILPIIRK